MSKYDIGFNLSLIEKSDTAVPQTILARMNELKMQGCEVIFRVFNQAGDEIYHLIKYFENIKTTGSDDLSFEKVLENELPAIRQTCQDLYGYDSLPQICFATVKICYNTRYSKVCRDQSTSFQTMRKKLSVCRSDNSDITANNQDGKPSWPLHTYSCVWKYLSRMPTLTTNSDMLK